MYCKSDIENVEHLFPYCILNVLNVLIYVLMFYRRCLFFVSTGDEKTESKISTQKEERKKKEQNERLNI